MRKLLIVLIGGMLLSSCHAGAFTNRDSWQQPQRILDSLDIRPGMRIGEVGAGKGYFTFKMAERLDGSGIIYANDIDPDGLHKIDRHCRENKIGNVKTILGKTSDPLFPADSLDLIIMVYVFHHLENPAAYLKTLTRYLKPGGDLVIIERDPERYGGGHHFLKKEVVLQTIRRAGWKIRRLYQFLPRDTIFICRFPDVH